MRSERRTERQLYESIRDTTVTYSEKKYVVKFKYLYNNNIVSDTENVSVMVLSTATTAVVSRNIREEFA